MAFVKYEAQKKLHQIQRSILKQKFAIEKKLKANTLEQLLEMESELQLYYTNIMHCINLVNRNIQSGSIQSCLAPNTVDYLNLPRTDAHLFRQLFQNSLSITELFEGIKHKCTTCCRFTPMEDTHVSLIEIRKIYMRHLEMFKISQTLCKAVLTWVDVSIKNTSSKVDETDMKTHTSDSTISSFFSDSAVHASSPLSKEKLLIDKEGTQ